MEDTVSDTASGDTAINTVGDVVNNEKAASIQVQNLTLGANEFLETHPWVVVFLEQMKSALKVKGQKMNLMWNDSEQDGFDEDYVRIRHGSTLCFVVPRVTKITMNDTRNMMLCEHFWFFYQEKFNDTKIPNHHWLKLIYECISQIPEKMREQMIKAIVEKKFNEKTITQKTVDTLTNFENYPYDTFY
jgi:hypothetical protein